MEVIRAKQFAYFMLYEGKNPKGKNQAKLAGVPIPIAQKISKVNCPITEYAQEIAREEGLVFSRVLRGRILKYSKIRYGQDEYFIPALDVVYSARQLALTGDLLKTAQDVGDNKVSSFCLDDGALMRLYDELRDKALFLCSGFKNVHKALEQGRETFSQLSCDKKRKVFARCSWILQRRYRSCGSFFYRRIAQCRKKLVTILSLIISRISSL